MEIIPIRILKVYFFKTILQAIGLIILTTTPACITAFGNPSKPVPMFPFKTCIIVCQLLLKKHAKIINYNETIQIEDYYMATNWYELKIKYKN